MKSILDRSFRYTPSAQTDLRKTFARVRREQRRQDPPPLHAAASAKRNVTRMARDGGGDGLRQFVPGKL